MTGNDDRINAEEARRSFEYDAETGLIRWLRNAGSVKAGTVVKSLSSKGYVHLQYRGRRYSAHRLAWLMVHGRWPLHEIDHINGDPADNRLANLRECTHAENHQNRAIRSDNTSGCPGVYWAKHANRWCARIKVKGLPRRLVGYFASFDEAAQAYREAKRNMHTFAPEVRAGGC